MKHVVCEKLNAIFTLVNENIDDLLTDHFVEFLWILFKSPLKVSP
jgi:hypothetical protein